MPHLRLDAVTRPSEKGGEGVKTEGWTDKDLRKFADKRDAAWARQVSQNVSAS